MAKSKLSEYKAKRAFDVTPEPPPQESDRGDGPLLFVVQMHAARRLHYDFRLECDGVLISWAIPKGPSLDRDDRRLAVMTEDHPYDYASFEGVIPHGEYGGGEVIVWDCGVYSPDEDGTWFHDREEAQRQIRAGIEKGKLSILLRGEKLKGSFALVRTKEAKTWLMLKHRDRFVSGDDVTADSRSVLSGATVEDLKIVPAHRIAASELVPTGRQVSMPKTLEPMLAETADAPFNDAAWIWEPKLDGYRVIAFVDAGKVRLQSRRGHELAHAFPKLVEALLKQDVDRMVLDGELVAFDTDGRPSFNAMQNRVQAKNEREIAAADAKHPVVFFAFDLLYFAGLDLRSAPHRDRRRYLAQCLLPAPLVQLVVAQDDGVALNAAALAAGFEGVVGKRKDSRYEAGKRSRAWLKIKPTQTAEFVIGGYTKGKGSRATLGSLLVGTFERGTLRYASHVGSGFDDRSLAAVKKKLEALRVEQCPFAEKPVVNAPVTWVEPSLVAELEFHEWTSDGSLRAPVFLRLRDDIDAKDVHRRDAAGDATTAAPKTAGRKKSTARAEPIVSTPRAKGKPQKRDAIGEILAQLDAKGATLVLDAGGERIKLSHLDREYWPADPSLQQPALTKRDLLRYLAEISPVMLPHLADRPLTMIRMPDGIEGQRFFQKHWTQKKPDFVDTIVVYSDSKDESHEYLVCNNLPTLLWLAQSGTLEFHVWHSRSVLSRDAATDSTDFAASPESLDGSILNYPDFVVFDIDPYIYSGKEKRGEEPELNNIAFEKGKEVAFWLRELLVSMSLEPIVKTSGKTGLHVFVPIKRTIDFDTARHVCELVGRHLMRRHPKDITMEWSVPKRTGKIFMDYNMNVRGKTLNVAYSPRGAVGAPVSMPLAWDELANAHPLDFRLPNAARRIAATGDRWNDALDRKQDLEKALDGAT